MRIIPCGREAGRQRWLNYSKTIRQKSMVRHLHNTTTDSKQSLQINLYQPEALRVFTPNAALAKFRIVKRRLTMQVRSAPPSRVRRRGNDYFHCLVTTG